MEQPAGEVLRLERALDGFNKYEAWESDKDKARAKNRNRSHGGGN